MSDTPTFTPQLTTLRLNICHKDPLIAPAADYVGIVTAVHFPSSPEDEARNKVFERLRDIIWMRGLKTFELGSYYDWPPDTVAVWWHYDGTPLVCYHIVVMDPDCREDCLVEYYVYGEPLSWEQLEREARHHYEEAMLALTYGGKAAINKILLGGLH